MRKEEFADKRLLCLRRAFLKEAGVFADSEMGISVCGKRVRLISTAMFEGRVSMPVPESFSEMPENIARIKYISKYRPPLILTSCNYDTDYGFHFLQEKEIRKEGEDTKALIGHMKNAVLRYAPGCVMYEQGRMGKDCEWFEYKNFTLDEETYNLQFITCCGTHFLIGTFNCRMACYDEWKELVLWSLERIRFREKEGGES